MKSTLLFIVGFVVGYLAGRVFVSADSEEVKYVKGETIRDTTFVPEPYFISSPTIPLFFFVDGKVDTAAIIADWILKRDYKQTLFDNETGKLDIDYSVQYNKMQELSYTFTPIYKEITRIQKRTWQPFASVSYSTFTGPAVGGGLFYRNIGLEYQLQRYNNETGHVFGLKYTF